MLRGVKDRGALPRHWTNLQGWFLRYWLVIYYGARAIVIEKKKNWYFVFVAAYSGPILDINNHDAIVM